MGRYELHVGMYGKAWVRSDLKGNARHFSLCSDCALRRDHQMHEGCSKLDLLRVLARLFHIVTPVWECPDFVEKDAT